MSRGATSVHRVLNVGQGEKDLTIQRRKYKIVKIVNLIPLLIGSHCWVFFLGKCKGERRTVWLISPRLLAVNLVFVSADTELRRIAALNPTCHATGMEEWAFWAAFPCLTLSSETTNFRQPYFLPVAQTLVERVFVGNKKEP